MITTFEGRRSEHKNRQRTSAIVCVLLWLSACIPADESNAMLTLGLAAISQSASQNSPRVYLFAVEGFATPYASAAAARSAANALCSSNKPAQISCNSTIAMLGVSATDTIAALPTNHGVPTNRILVSPNGTVIGNNWADLLDGTIQNSISAAGLSPSVKYWTAAGSDGTWLVPDRSCFSWTSNSAGHGAWVGDPSSTSSTWLDGGVDGSNCTVTRPLLCLCF